MFIGESRQLDLGSGLFIGGIPWQRMVNEKFPVSIWSGVLKFGYVGCIRELILNDEPVDVVKYTEEQDLGETLFLSGDSVSREFRNNYSSFTESIEPVCRVDTAQCTSNSCFNQGECIAGWNRFTCDCSKTEFGGPTCSKGNPLILYGRPHSITGAANNIVVFV